MAIWMLYALVVGCLLAGAAAALGRIPVLGALGSRWIWLASLLLTMGLTALAPARASLLAAAEGSPAEPVLVVEGGAEGGTVEPAGVLGTLDTVRERAATVLDAGAAFLARLPAGGQAGLALLWALSSASVLVAFGWSARRIRRSVRRWPAADLHGVRVRVSPDAGPAVVGMGAAEIVVPQWLLSLAPAEQRLVLAHEVQHRRARDPLILAAGCVAAIVIPWHPAVWWMLGRLQLAVELDCDRRVLRTGAGAEGYGSLLIDIAGRPSGFRGIAPALAAPHSHLERRLLAMRNEGPNTGRIRHAGFTILSLLLVLAACEAELPTAAEVQDMDAAAAEQSARRAGLVSEAGAATYLVDGQVVTSEAARAIPPERIASVEVVRQGAAGPEIRITTRDGTAATEGRTLAEQPHEPTARVRFPGNLEGFTGLLLIDGEIADPKALRELSTERIERIEVIKGPAATRLYSDPAARNGVIHITLKPEARRLP